MGDHAYYGTFTEDCAEGKTVDEVSCGQFVSNCNGSPDKLMNFEENTTFFGTESTGEYRRVYRQFDILDKFCSGAPTVEYIFTGMYAIDGDSNCPNCKYGAYSKIEITITRSQFTIFSNDSLIAFQTSCPCYPLTWTLGAPIDITTCVRNDCDLSLFPGINGLSIGAVTPSYGTIMRFNTYIGMTDLGFNPSTGYSNSFTAHNHPLFLNTQFTDCNAPAINTYCGVYNDGCRGGSANSDGDNVVRRLSLLGENFGEFQISQSLYLPQDTDCSVETDLNAMFHLYGTFAMHGDSDCGGSCEGQNAQKIELSLAYSVVQVYYPPYITYLTAQCPCGGTWSVGEPRTLADCPIGTCDINVRGIIIGSSTPVFGSVLRFGNMTTLTELNPSSTAGYATAFNSLDQALVYDQTTEPTTCPASYINNMCGQYMSSCSGYSANATSAVNTIENMTFIGATQGTFRRIFKMYSPGTAQRCGNLLLQTWDIQGTFELTGPSNCGGTCKDANATRMTVTQATITLSVPDDVTRFNSLCGCGGSFEQFVPRVLDITTPCDLCRLDGQLGAHGLTVGTNEPTFASVSLVSGRLALTKSNKNPTIGYNTPFAPETDRVYILDPVGTSQLNCLPGPTPAPTSAPSTGGGSGGLSAGDGLLIAFFVILAVYVIGGMSYNYYNSRSTNIADLAPNASFWRSIPGYISDGAKFAFVGWFGLRPGYSFQGSGSSASYSTTSNVRSYNTLNNSE